MPGPILFGLTPEQIALELSPVQFERIVQSYLAGHMTRAGLGKSKNGGDLPGVHLFADYQSGQWTKWKWTIGWDGAQETKGEIFAPCCSEHARRLGFTQACKLLQIDGPEAPGSHLSGDPVDDIPF